MSKTIIVWFRADLRIHDHPALAAAVEHGDTIVPVFILDDTLLLEHQASNRNRFLMECLQDLKQSLKKLGGDLFIRRGDYSQQLIALAKETNADAVYYIADFTPYSLKRDTKVEAELKKVSIEARSFGGALTVSALQKLVSKAGTPYKVFTPFWRQWSEVQRREVAKPPKSIAVPSIESGEIPSVESLTKTDHLSPNVVIGGEAPARIRFREFMNDGIDDYHEENNNLGIEGTSRLSPYIHMGCISTREMESQLPDSDGAKAWHRQLAWRDFYYYILFHFPHPEREFQERYRTLGWINSDNDLKAWKDGMTGYPVVDAAMRQLKQEGWMHNRGRLIVGSFLTKDLGLDWRKGEAHFMEWLLDGDVANNNGNWQWIASVGVDPAPLFRRLYNPTSQRKSYDPSGSYVKKYIPELKDVPDSLLSEPWKMSAEEQQKYNCTIGTDYPKPVIDHREARLATIERYRSA
jgi:deoxyribodipyrimidine photo-lyase